MVETLTAQTLINNNNVVLDNDGFKSRIFNSDKIYFNGTKIDNNSKNIYVLDASETITPLLDLQALSGYEIQFELNNLIYLHTINGEISTINTLDDSVDPIFSIPSNMTFVSRGLAESNGEIYFVAYDFNISDYKLYRLNAAGAIVASYAFPGPVQNTNRIHSNNNLIYYFTNTLTPNANHYYKFDPTVGSIVTITSTEYNSTVSYPDYSNMEVNGEIFTIGYPSGQLTSDLNPVDLTCFELVDTGEGLTRPYLLGPIGGYLYLSLNSAGFGGSVSGIYRYPELANEGLCEDEEIICDQDIKPDLHVEDGDVYLDESCRGIIFTTSNDDCYRMTVNDNGDLETTLVTCPN